MYSILYRYEDIIIRSFISVLLIICLYLSILVNYNLWFVGNRNELKVENTSTNILVDSTIKALVDSVPKNIEEVYTLLQTNNLTKNIINIELQGTVIIIKKKLNEIGYTIYLQYSKTYDCTIVKDSIKDKDPVQIFYHYEYDNKNDLSVDMFNFINSYKIQSEKKVILDKKEDGSLKIRID